MAILGQLNFPNTIKAEAKTLGFSLCGFTNLQHPELFPLFKNWVTANYHGEMGYLSRQETLNKRLDPQTLFPGAKSILVLAFPYSGWNDFPIGYHPSVHTGRIASYAMSPDYHNWLPQKMAELMDRVQSKINTIIQYKCFTDSAPILEREIAMRAGLGWIGRNSCLISPNIGSFFLLGEVFLDVELPISETMPADHCGSCQRCIQACPTGCILPDRTLDARKCISYLTIESKRAIPTELRPAMGDWVFGCDICQSVCPWNTRAARESENKEEIHLLSPYVDLVEEMMLDQGNFKNKYQFTPITRTKRYGFLRNTAVALGNQPDQALLPIFKNILEQENEPLVRQHVAWAVSRIGSTAAFDLLRKQFRLETDLSVQAEYEMLLS